MVEVTKAPAVVTAKAGIKYVVNRLPICITTAIDGQDVVFNGVGKGPKGLVIPGAPYGVTSVETSVWEKYMAMRHKSSLIKNREIYAVDTPTEIDQFVQTKGTRLTGFEPIDPQNPSKGLAGPKVERAPKDLK